MAVEAEVTAAAVILAVEAILAVVHTSVVVGISAARILAEVAAACVSVGRILAAHASAAHILAVRGSAGPGHRALQRAPVSEASAHPRSAATQTGPPAVP
jgi:hypothetical protein